MENQTNKKGTPVAIVTMMFLFAMISSVTNIAVPFGIVWKWHCERAGVMGNMMNFLAYLLTDIPADMMTTKYGYKETALVVLALGFIDTAIQYGPSRMDGSETGAYVVYLVDAFVCGFCVYILNTVINPMLNLLGGGDSRGNQLIQTGGSLSSLVTTLTPIFAGSVIGETTKETSLGTITPLLLIMLVIFIASFVTVWFTQLTEPETEKTDVVGSIKEALRHRQLLLDIIAIFFYIGVEVGTPGQLFFYLSEPITEGGVLSSVATAGLIAGVCWMLMLVGRFVSAPISDKVSSHMQSTVTSAVALLLLLVTIFMLEDVKMSLSVPNLTESTFDRVEVPTKVLFIILCDICISVMWGVIFNLVIENLGKYTATASGLFMTMVVGGSVMPLIQNLVTTKVGDIQNYWLIAGILAYMLFYVLVDSHPSEKA